MSTVSPERSSVTSMTITRLCTSTCVAASPIPGAAYIVSAMSAASRRIDSSTSVTGSARFFSLGSG